jgi:hypothetical protein
MPSLRYLRLDCEHGSLQDKVHIEEISSSINRLSSRIYQLKLQCCCKLVACGIMKTLSSVEDLRIMERGHLSCLVLVIANSKEYIYLPKMRILQVESCPGRFKELVKDLSRLLKARGKESKMALSRCDAVPIERLLIQMDWAACGRSCCWYLYRVRKRHVDKALLNMSCCWPHFSVIDVQSGKSKDGRITMKAHAVAAGTLIDLNFLYPEEQWYESAYINERYHRILENSSFQELYVDTDWLQVIYY